jgi:glycosyltransferase involved in cell wall biosynthesis
VSIVFLSPTGQTGGAEAVLRELIAGLRESHPSWALRLIVASDGPLVARVRALGVPVDVVPFPSSLARLGDWGVGGGRLARLRFLTSGAAAALPTLAYLHRLRAALRAGDPQVVHTNGLKMHVLGAWARPRGSAVLWHLHDFVRRRPFAARLLQRYAHRCSSVVANSRSVAEDARHVCGSDVSIHPVWNAVDLERFSPVGPALDLDALAQLPPAAGVIRVGLVATYARWKGHHTFLKAVAMARPSLPIRAYVIGGPVYATAGSQTSLTELRDLAAALGIGSRVGFTGFVDDTSAAMRSLDVVVHASTDPEPFGLVIVEAMACGRAVIASMAGGVVELTQPGVNVMGHQPGDARSLAQAIEALVGDAALRARLGQAGRDTAERFFNRRRLTAEFARIYESLASAS